MRLIDANKLCLNFNDWQLSEAPNDKTGHEPIEYTSHNMQSMIYRTIGDAIRAIEEAQTVEAIPIEWIEERIKNIEDTLLEMSYRMLIEDWREHNQRGEKQ